MEPYAWLGAGAITLGMGAALAGGTGVAYADDGSTSDPSSASAPAGGDSSDAPTKRAVGRHTDANHQSGRDARDDGLRTAARAASGKTASTSRGKAPSSSRGKATSADASAETPAAAAVTSPDQSRVSETSSSPLGSATNSVAGPANATGDTQEAPASHRALLPDTAPQFVRFPARTSPLAANTTPSYLAATPVDVSTDYVAPTSATVTTPSPTVRIAATTPPVTLRSVVADILTWSGLGSPPNALDGLPTAPLGPIFTALWGVVREIEATHCRRPVVNPLAVAVAAAGPLPVANPDGDAAVPAAQAAAVSPAATADATTELTTPGIDVIVAGLNNAVGWIPGVGTLINGIKLVADVGGLVGAVVTLNVQQIGMALGNIVVDTIGLIPVVGAPIASLIYDEALGGNARLGAWVRVNMQNYLDSSTWAIYGLHVESVDVSRGLFGAYSAVATVSTPTHPGGSVEVDITNTGLQIGYSVPLEGRLQLLAIAWG